MLLLAGTAVYAQMAPKEENVPQRPKFTKSQAELLIPRPLLQPVRSMIPSNAGAIDTLDTANPLVKLVLYSDNTWKYVKDGNLLKQEDYFTKNWDNQSMDPYGVDFKSLPDKVTLWLIDNPTDFCCPNQVKVFSKFGFRHKRRHQGCDPATSSSSATRTASRRPTAISPPATSRKATGSAPVTSSAWAAPQAAPAARTCISRHGTWAMPSTPNG